MHVQRLFKIFSLRSSLYCCIVLCFAACTSSTTNFTEKLPPLPTSDNLSTSQQIRFLNEQLEETSDKATLASLYFKRANIYLQSKKENVALEDIQKAISLDSSKSIYFFALAKAHYLRKEPRQTFLAAEKAKNMGVNELELYRLYAHAAFEEKKWLASLKAFEEVSKRNPKDVESWYYQGLIWNVEKDTAQAFSFLTKAIAIDAKFVPAYEKMMLIYNEQNLPKNAWKIAQTALPITKYHPKIAYQYANTWLNLTKTDSAMIWYRKALEKPTSLTKEEVELASFRVGSYLIDKKYYPQAEEYLQQTLTQNSKNTQANFLLGFLYEFKLYTIEDKLERYKKAKTYLEIAYENQPENLDYNEALQRISEKIRREEYKLTPEYAEYVRRQRLEIQRVQDSIANANGQ